MKVKIRDLEPNPFRDMKNYPINEEKIQSLTNSINETGFWDNILARKKNEKIQIAYGHHRLVILQRDFKPDHIIDIPVRDLDDVTMIRIMANENDDNWATSVDIVDETVRVVFDYLKSFLELIQEKTRGLSGITEIFKELPRPKGKGHPDVLSGKEKNVYEYSPLAWQISNWLGGNWKEERVYFSLDRLKLIQEGMLDKEAVEKLPTTTIARHFTGAVKKFKEISPEQQRKAAERIIETQDFSKEGIEYEVLEEKSGLKKKRGEKEKEFEVFIAECSKLINILNRKLETLINFKSDFDSEYYKETFARFSFDASIDMLRVRLKQLSEEDK